ARARCAGRAGGSRVARSRYAARNRPDRPRPDIRHVRSACGHGNKASDVRAAGDDTSSRLCATALVVAHAAASSALPAKPTTALNARCSGRVPERNPVVTAPNYLGCTFGLPPGLPGGGITGILPTSGVGALMSGSTFGGHSTPSLRASLSLRLV